MNTIQEKKAEDRKRTLWFFGFLALATVVNVGFIFFSEWL